VSLNFDKKDMRECPVCGEIALIRIDRWGNVRDECLYCAHEETVKYSRHEPDANQRRLGVF
jgi:hypothetical protein